MWGVIERISPNPQHLKTPTPHPLIWSSCHPHIPSRHNDTRVEQLVVPCLLAAVDGCPEKAETEDQSADPVADGAAQRGAPEAKALRKLRHPLRSRKLRDYLA